MKKAIRIIFLFAVLAFIFYMSSKNNYESYNYNFEFVRFLKNKSGIDLYGLYGSGYIDFIVRKLGHFFEFSLLGIAAYFVFSAFKVRWTTILTILFCIFLAATDEFHQLYVPGRYSSYLDVVIDSIASIMTVSFISLIRTIKYEIFDQKVKYILWNKRSQL